MANMVKLSIDGKEVQAQEGTNLIDAAAAAGIHIPNLCYMKGMKPAGACRLCMVEIEGAKGLSIACNTKVKEGMSVKTSTDRILESRKFVIDLILSMHPLDCMTCTKAGVCSLQQYAYDFEIKESTYTRKKFGYPVDEANPFIRRDPDYCILCGKCVKACKEQGTNVLDFMGRGVGAKVVTAGDKPLQESQCTFCGSCVDACPVNALLEADRWRKGREWDYEKINSVCMLCGNGCDITVCTKEGEVQKINAAQDEGSVNHFICAYGRFGYDCLAADTRLTAPMIRENGTLKETTWDNALAKVADKLKSAGADAGFISTAGILNEDALALSRLAEIVGTKNLDTTVSLYANTESLVESGNADFDNADLIVLAGLNPSQWDRVLPALDASVRKRIARGAKLIVINSSDTLLDAEAAVVLRGDEIKSIMGLAKSSIDKGAKVDAGLKSMLKEAASTEESQKAGELFTAAASPLVLSSPSLFNAAYNLSLIKGTAIAVPAEANARGIALMGIRAEGKSFKQISTEGSKVLYAIGEVMVNKRPETDFLIIQTTHMTELAKQADVVLPASAYLESAGTMVDYTGKLKYLPKAIEPQGQSQSHKDIFINIAKAMGAQIKPPTESEVKKALKVKSKVSVKEFKKADGLVIPINDLIESSLTSVIYGSRLAWLKEAKAEAAI